MSHFDSISPAASQPSVSLRDVFSVLWRWSWLVVLLVAISIGTAAFVSKRTPPAWRAQAKVLLIQRSTAGSTSPQAGYVAPMIESVDTQVQMLQSYAMAQRTVDHLKNLALKNGQSPDSVTVAPETLQQAITANNAKDTNLIDVDVEWGGRDEAAKLANAVCDTFVLWKREVAQQNIQETLFSLEARASRAKAQMVDAENAETAFKLSHHLTDVPTQQQDALQRLLATQEQLNLVSGELLAQQAHLRSVSERLHQLNQALQSGTGVRDDTLIVTLQSQISQLQIQRTEAGLKYKAAFPGVLSQLDARIKDLQHRLDEAVRGTLDNRRPSLTTQSELNADYQQTLAAIPVTRARLAGAKQLYAQLQRQTAAIPETNMQYGRVVRNAELARSLYSSLQASLNEANIDKDLAGGNVGIAQYAFVPDAPFRPNRERDLAVGLAVGLGLALVSIILLEQSDRRVRTLSALQRLVPNPVIGSMTRMSLPQARRMLEGDTPPQMSEAYSIARANLTLAMRGSSGMEPWYGQVVLITSSVPGEGKSVTAAEMARSFARSGKSVILVDADLRRPAQNRLFHTAEPSGLADVLAGTMSLEEALVASDIENLSILHSGSARRSPTELFSLPSVAETLDSLRNEADVVIVDTPACSVVADALLLAPHVDCVLHVIGAGQVDEELVRSTTTALAAASRRGLVIFVNRAPDGGVRAYKGYHFEPDGNGHSNGHPVLNGRSNVDAEAPKSSDGLRS